MLTLILAESALETIPESLWNHPAIRKYSKQHGKHPKFTLLDRSYHHTTMKTLQFNQRRGRPDIVHFALLEALGSPLNKEKLLKIYVHTIDDHVMSVNPETRLPRNYSRFVNLVEQLFEFKQVPPNSQKPLLSLKQETLAHLLGEVRPSHVLALSRIGQPRVLENVISSLAKTKAPAALIGGFPEGHLSKTTLQLADETVCIDPEMLETWTVVSRVVYEFERAISLPTRRLKPAETSR